jgi:hypothetical protein
MRKHAVWFSCGRGAKLSRLVCLGLLLALCLPFLPACGSGGTLPDLPDGANGYVKENMTLCLPTNFYTFESGNAKNLLALTDGYAVVYLRKQVAADTGTSDTYFQSLDAAGYGELYCDLAGIENYGQYLGHTDNSAAYFYVVEASDPDDEMCVYLYFVEEEKAACFWLVECRYPAIYADYYSELFSTWDEYFRLKS